MSQKSRDEIIDDLPQLIVLAASRGNKSICTILEACQQRITDLEAQLATANEKAAALDRLEGMAFKKWMTIGVLDKKTWHVGPGRGQTLTEAIMNAGVGE